MAGYPKPTGEICDSRCDVCKDFAFCGNGHVTIICASKCDECMRREVCKNRESWPDE